MRTDGTLDPEVVSTRLIPQGDWLSVFGAIASSIEFAHNLAPDRWGLRLGPDSLMLKVGSHEVLQIGPWHLPVHLIVDGQTVPKAVRTRSDLSFSREWSNSGTTGSGFYSTNPGTEACNLPIEAVERLYPLLEPSHREAIRRAAKRFNPATRRGHSPAMVDYVAAQVGRSLPQPSYVPPPDLKATRRPPPARSGGGFGTFETNALVEKAAIEAVTKRYRGDGWSVQSVEAEKCGYDLLCTCGAEERHVEVKGSSGAEQKFIITANELDVANRDPAFVLALVTSALGDEPSIYEWPVSEFLRAFSLRPISFVATRVAAPG